MQNTTLISRKTALTSTTEIALAEYRHRIFVQNLGWDLPLNQQQEHAREERDQFDHDGTFYAIRYDDQGEIVGCARLLPTTGSYLLKEIFPHLYPLGELPNSCKVWELSRLAVDVASKATNLPDVNDMQTMERVSSLMQDVLQFAKKNNIDQIIGVTWLSMERLFRRIGIQCHRVGKPTMLDGKAVIACYINVN